MIGFFVVVINKWDLTISGMMKAGMSRKKLY